MEPLFKSELIPGMNELKDPLIAFSAALEPEANRCLDDDFRSFRPLPAR